MRVLLSSALPQGQLCAPFFLPHTTIGIPISSFWQVQVPYTKSQFQRFRVVHWAAQITFHSCISYSPPPPISRNVRPHSPFLALGPFSCFYRSLYFCLAPPELLYEQYVRQIGFLLDPSILCRRRHPTLFQIALFVICLIQPYQLATSFFFVCSLLYIVNSTFSRPDSFSVGKFPVLLLVLHFSSYLSTPLIVLFSLLLDVLFRAVLRTPCSLPKLLHILALVYSRSSGYIF